MDNQRWIACKRFFGREDYSQMIEKRLEQFDCVEVISHASELDPIINHQGVVIGFSEGDGYLWCAVYVEGQTWMVREDDLKSLGKKADPEDIYPSPIA